MYEIMSEKIILSWKEWTLFVFFFEFIICMILKGVVYSHITILKTNF